MDINQDGNVISDFEDDGPVMEVSEVSSFDVNEIEPIVVTNFLWENFFQMRMFKFSVMSLVTVRDDQRQMLSVVIIDNKYLCISHENPLSDVWINYNMLNKWKY